MRPAVCARRATVETMPKRMRVGEKIRKRERCLLCTNARKMLVPQQFSLFEMSALSLRRCCEASKGPTKGESHGLRIGIFARKKFFAESAFTAPHRSPSADSDRID
jgi:hypothetical protein